MTEVRCVVCGHLADNKDLLLLELQWEEGVGWFCSKGCYEDYEARVGFRREGEHYGVVYGVIRDD